MRLGLKGANPVDPKNCLEGGKEVVQMMMAEFVEEAEQEVLAEFVVEVEKEVLVLLCEHMECSLVQNAAPFPVLYTSTFVPWHQKQHYLRQNHTIYNSFIRGRSRIKYSLYLLQ